MNRQKYQKRWKYLKTQYEKDYLRQEMLNGFLETIRPILYLYFIFYTYLDNVDYHFLEQSDMTNTVWGKN